MSTFAGSAIKQGPKVSRIDKWSEWNLTTKQPVWLLLSGACYPPEHIGISSRKDRGERSGNFLAGISHDLSNMESTILKVEAQLYNTVRDLKITKVAAVEHITKFFEECKLKATHPICCTTQATEKLPLEIGAFLMGQSVSKKLLTRCLQAASTQ